MDQKEHVFITMKALTLIQRTGNLYLLKGVIEADKRRRLLHHFSNKAKVKGIKLYKDAIKLYKSGDRDKAYFNLGYSLHLLQDLAIPAHSKGILHLWNTDDLEIYMRNNFDNLEYEIIRPLKGINVEDFFRNMSGISCLFPCKKNGFYVSIIFKLFGSKPKLPQFELKTQAEGLLPLAISHTAGLLNLFYKEVKDER